MVTSTINVISLSEHLKDQHQANTGVVKNIYDNTNVGFSTYN